MAQHSERRRVRSANKNTKLVYLKTLPVKYFSLAIRETSDKKKLNAMNSNCIIFSLHFALYKLL